MRRLLLIISTCILMMHITPVNASPVPLCNDGSRMLNHKVVSIFNQYILQYRLHELEHYGKTKDNKYDCYYTYLGAIEHAAYIIYFDDEKIYAKKIKIKWMREDKLAADAATHALTAIELSLGIKRPELIILRNRIKENRDGGAVWCPNLGKTITVLIGSAPEDPRYNVITIMADSREIM